MGASFLALAKSIYSILYIYFTHLFIFLVIYLLYSAVGIRRPFPYFTDTCRPWTRTCCLGNTRCAQGKRSRFFTFFIYNALQDDTVLQRT